MPSTWLTVMTPVPPMPEKRTVNASAGTCGTGSGRPAPGSPLVPADGRACLAPSGSTVTVANAGQSPRRHDMSKLQLVWWMRVLRPYAVSTGCTDRQLLLSPQSPHPSHTRSLMTTRKPGLATMPRLRSRRSSAAQRWSWTSTVTPGTAASSTWLSISRVRSRTSTRPAAREPKSASSHLPGSSDVTTIRATPSSSSDWTTSGTAIWPCGSWPPVIATVPL